VGTEHSFRTAPPFAVPQDFCDGCVDSEPESVEAEDQASYLDTDFLFDDPSGVLWGVAFGGGVGG